MFRWWAFWRRVQYGIAFLIVVCVIGYGLYKTYLYVPPNCFDTLQNGTERGVDCGGVCKRICSSDIIPPIIQWAESFKVVDGQYNAVAYIENKNKNTGSPEVHYRMKLFDDQGLITERTGVTVLPPDSIYPIFEGRIMTGNRKPTRTTFEFEGEAVWLPSNTGREQFKLEKRDLSNADSKPKLTANIQNTTLDEARDVDVVAVIFDRGGHPLAASRTVIDYFGGRTTKDVVFTWPEPIAKTLRSCEVPTDVMLAIDLSGSMDDDGGNPPEPLNAVRVAAESFVSRLKKNDQAGVVTYATGAQVTETLTHDSGRIGDSIRKLSILPLEQRGSTNSGDAIKRMREEFGSERHNPDARKVAILLTDGLTNMPEKDPEPYAQNEARLLKDMGVQFFTIGLGGKLNETFLRDLASSPSQYYKAPTIKEVDGIYTSITKAICEDGAAVIDVIPKAKTSFVPLE